MKRITVLLLTLILLFVSCGSDSSEEYEYKDSYLYTTIGGVLYKISTVTATVTPVCPDPLCGHRDGSCPFYGVESIDPTGKYIYYLKGISGWGYYEKLCRFDLISGKYEELFMPSEGTIFSEIVGEGYVFMTVAVMDSDFQYEYSVWRYDVDNGDCLLLSEEPYESPPDYYLIENGRVYWKGDEGDYSTDLDCKNKIDGDIGYSSRSVMDGYSYKLEAGEIKGTEGYRQQCFRIIRTDVASGERTMVTEDAASAPILHNGKIIYGKVGELRYIGKVEDGETGEWRDHYDKYGGKLYICDGDGGNERVLCDYGETGYTISVSMGIVGSERGIGDWIAVRMFNYVSAGEDDPEKVKRGDNVYMLINIETGEMKEALIE